MKILDAAEELFGMKGFVSTSVRDVAAKAGTSPGSINYHFGSKNGLIRAVIQRISEPLTDTRFEHLACLAEKHGEDSIPLREVLKSFLEPLFDVRDGDRRESISRLLAQVAVASDPRIGAYWNEYLGPTGRTYVNALHKAAPHLSRAEFFLRYQLLLMATYDSRTFTSWYWDWANAEFGHDLNEITLDERLSLCEQLFAAAPSMGRSETDETGGATPATGRE